MKENIKLTWIMNRLPFQATAYRDGVTTLTVSADGEGLTCSIPFDFHERPLTLTGAEAPQRGDRVALVLMPHRIELYVNDALTDEEWPAGE